MTKNHPNLSIIVPVYNVAPYLPQFLDRVTEQTMKEIEIITINDGSTDNSREILQQYAAKDTRIIIINQKNKGAAKARNRGIDIARGEWLLFLDADDVPELNMAEELYQRGMQTQSDIVICEANVLHNEKTFLIPHSLNRQIIPEKEPFSIKDTSKIFSITNSVAWNKLYSRDFVLKHKLKFQNLKSCNDIGFCMLSLAYAQRISCVKKALYNYRQGTTGQISATRGKHAENIVLAGKYMRQKLVSHPNWQEISDDFYKKMCMCFLYEYIGCCPRKKLRLMFLYKSFLPPEYLPLCFPNHTLPWRHWFSVSQYKQRKIIYILGIKISYPISK